MLTPAGKCMLYIPGLPLLQREVGHLGLQQGPVRIKSRVECAGFCQYFSHVGFCMGPEVDMSEVLAEAVLSTWAVCCFLVPKWSLFNFPNDYHRSLCMLPAQMHSACGFSRTIPAGSRALKPSGTMRRAQQLQLKLAGGLSGHFGFK